MLSELKGKRLLVLGGSAWIGIIKAFADENHISLITVGNDPASPLARVGEYHNIDSTNHDAMKRFIIDAKIDGVYMGSNETVIRHAVQYLAELGFPCYCTLTQWDTLMNKRNFKKLCQMFEIPVTPEYPYTPEEPCDIAFPVIVKPSDGCGSTGITICEQKEELMDAYRFACEKSPTHEALVEKLVNNSGMDVFFQITDGKPEWCALGDKYPVQFQEGAGSVAGARVFPSLYTAEFRERFETKIKRMFEYVGLRQGLIWMEVFHDGHKYYFNEVGYRPNGSLSIVGIDYFCGINTVASDIYYALTGRSKSHGFSSLILKTIPKNKKKICEYWIACHPGQIGRVEGIEALLKRGDILAAFPKYEVGSIIPHTNGFAQNFCVIHFAYDDVDEMRRMIRLIQTTVSVRDVTGNDMIIHKTNDFIEGLFLQRRSNKCLNSTMQRS